MIDTDSAGNYQQYAAVHFHWKREEKKIRRIRSVNVRRENCGGPEAPRHTTNSRMRHGPIVAPGYIIQIPNYCGHLNYMQVQRTTADLENNFHARHSIEEDTPFKISTVILCTRDE